MKKLLLIIFLFTGIVNAQIVNIPDANFKAKLLSSSPTNNVAYNNLGIAIKIDVNNDGEIQQSEADAVDQLGVYSSNISNLSGINSFTNLRRLLCFYNQIVSLDVSALTSLEELNCDTNFLTNLTIGNISTLKQLYCGWNQLTTLNVSGLINLEKLGCSNNQLPNLNLSGLVNLKEIHCGWNQLATIDLSGFINLTTFDCRQNLFSNLDLTGLVNLASLSLGWNQLTSLDLSGLPNLISLGCNNNLALSTVSIKNGSLESYIDFSNCPNLSFVCCDNSEILNVQTVLSSNNLPNVVVNSYCSFTPGGNYNTITGSMIFDGNNNGCDLLDNPASYMGLNLTLNAISLNSSVYSNSNGNYSFNTNQSGVYELIPNLENPNYFNVSPNPATVIIPTIDNTTTTQNFCISANGIHPDLEIVVSPIVPARPGFDAVYQIVYRNKGNQTLSQLYGINFFYNENLMDFVSASTATSSANSGSLSWDFANLQPFESRSITVTLNINEPTDLTNPVNIDDELQFTTSILPMAGDETTSDNTFVLHQTVVGAYDPNDITCLEGDSVAPSQIGNYLHYIINFENTGNYQAENIVVQDVIDATKFDISSLQIMNSSDPVYAKLTGNVAEFIFENIDLDSGGHGNILLKVRTKSSLQNGDFVNKNANIYFDYNAPITTNIANTIFQALGVTENNLDNSIVIYPNPAASVINVKSSFDIKSIQLYDIQGRILQTKLTNEMNAVIDISDKSNGVYFLKVVSDKGIKVEKIIKE